MTVIMKRKLFPSLALLSAVLAVSACRVPTTAQPGTATVLISDYSGNFSYKADVGDGSHDVYFVFTNTGVSVSSDDMPTAKGLSVDGVELPGLMEQPAGGSSETSASIKDRIAYDNRTLLARIGVQAGARSISDALVQSPPAADVAGTTSGNMAYFNSATSMTGGAATCRSVTTATTAQGSRTLNIWVANDCWSGTGTGKKHYVTQTMVDQLAARFLASGSDNDIYDWVTNIIGPEWGSTGYSDLISANGEITILLADIAGDGDSTDAYGDDGGIVGYFYSLNNMRNDYLPASYAGLSNERIMFVVDAVMYANPDDNGYSVDTTTEYLDNGWLATDYWAEECFSTLAHEFQHMIQFYRKGVVVRGDGYTADTWIDEMCSQLVEDLVADKIGVMGPRGVAYGDYTAGSSGNYNGRIPYFNKYLSLGLEGSSSYDVYDYSFSYSFGAWLLRNYGGARFVKNVVYDNATDSQAITNAIKAFAGKTYALPNLLQRWAVAVLGSSRTDMPYGFRYNTGAASSSTSGLTAASYTVGSINFFNYSPAPAILDSSSLGSASSFPSASNIYYKAATGLSGSRTFQIHLPAGVGFSVYVTP